MTSGTTRAVRDCRVDDESRESCGGHEDGEKPLRLIACCDDGREEEDQASCLVCHDFLRQLVGGESDNTDGGSIETLCESSVSLRGVAKDLDSL